MNTKQLCTLVSAIFLATSLAAIAWAKPPKMKMTTEIPASITIADKVETRIGTLTFEYGFPTEETAQKIYDQLDFQRAVESVMMTTPAASLTGFRNGIRQYGPDNQAAVSAVYDYIDRARAVEVFLNAMPVPETSHPGSGIRYPLAEYRSPICQICKH